MIKIFLVQSRYTKYVSYIEDIYSSYDIINMDKESFVGMLHNFKSKYGDIHSCYDTLINHIGRFVREYGENWAGEEVAIYARKFGDPYQRYYFNKEGQLERFPYGFFG